MAVELVRLALRAAMAVTPSWTFWLGLTSFTTVVATLPFFYERCRRRTYIVVLKAIQPGTVLLDGAGHKKGITVIRLCQSRLTGHRNAIDLEDLRR
jgi:hypothetical protein